VGILLVAASSADSTVGGSISTAGGSNSSGRCVVLGSGFSVCSGGCARQQMYCDSVLSAC
jgi:hypothetical protein